MKILISGGAGFIGSHLVDFYLRQGEEVWCVDNFLTGRRESIVSHSKFNLFHFLEEDICKLDVDKLPGDFSLVVHLASPASPPDYLQYPVETMRTNSLGTEKMLELAGICKCRFLFASTSEVYGDPEIPVQDETYWGHVNPVGPRAVYDEAKRYGEALVMTYHRYYGVNTCIARIFNTYGPGMRINDGRVIPNFIRQALTGQVLTVYGDGNQTRSFCYVDDLIRGLVALVDSEEHCPVNLGNPEEFSILQLVKELERIMGMRLKMEFKPLPEDDPKRRKPDISRATRLLHWKPVVCLEEGLKKTVDYFRDKLNKKGER